MDRPCQIVNIKFNFLAAAQSLDLISDPSLRLGKKYLLPNHLNFARRGHDRGSGRVSHFAHRLGNRTPGGSNYPPSPFSRINFFPIDEAARQYGVQEEHSPARLYPGGFTAHLAAEFRENSPRGVTAAP